MRKAANSKALRQNAAPGIKPCETAVSSTLKNYFGYCLYKSAVRLKFKIENEFKQFGISTQQCGIMTLLMAKGSLNQQEISAETGIDRASMVRFIDGLESQGYVARVSHANDRRRNQIEITGRGTKVLSKLREISKSVEEEFLKPLNSSEKSQLRNIVPKLLEAN